MRDWRQNRTPYTNTHDMLRVQAERRFSTEVAQNGQRRERVGKTELDYWKRAATIGLVAPQVPEQYGGVGLDISYNFVITGETHAAKLCARLRQ